ncbi:MULTISPECIES: DUF1257 domain-containing protein [Nostocales]|uniref:DUF1257 domain-containing protein n=3 Tax=Nostocales TaxID=1161 RepID=A0A0C1MY33_9CYAN|nr:DUF1257 domain-containing protein [Tolypothrix bouteillei]KAF3889290.1 DUF1257 domain-containing protein [Tolypothrix bouteillei VB521301]
MSHFRSFPTKLTDLEILKTTLRDLGLHAIVNGTVRGVNGQRVSADIVAVLDGECDLGWSRNNDGTFDLIADIPGVAIKHNQAQLIHSINQKYAINKTLSQIKQPGLQNSNVKLVVQS